MTTRLDLEYDGTAFAGWQAQPGARSVQGVLEAALSSFLGEPVRVASSGRTDAGVHAWGQVAAFTTAVERSDKAVRDGLNALLPDDVAVRHAERAPDDFDPRRWTRTKRYRYVWLDRPTRSPLRRTRAWHVRDPLDVDAMHAAAQALVGRHDFTSFRASGCNARHPVRHLDALAVRRADDEVWLEVDGNGFLRHMIRIVAGTLADVGRGRRAATDVAAILGARDRARAGKTAPAHGLYLVSVTYGDGRPERLADDDADEGP